MNLILIALITLGVIGAIGAVILFFVAQKFYVYEDPRIGQVDSILPQANCGGCGYPGCKGFADACVKADTLEGLNCPVGGAPVMEQVASILGREAVTAEPKVAVLRCNGTCAARPRTSTYDGARSCAVAANTYAGETGCTYGCLGHGDCVVSCDFDAIHMNPETSLPEVDQDKCTACGSCVKACPKLLLQLRPKGKNNRRVFVSCVNKDKGGVARKACSNACIGCSKCMKECPFDAIVIENNLAYIDFNKCKSCRKCVDVCPTGAIHAVNFPPKKERPAAPAAEAGKTATAEAPKAKAVKTETAQPETPKKETPKANDSEMDGTDTPKTEA